MSLYDWNKDGKKDLVDDYIEYKIYKDITKKRKNTSKYNKGRSSTGSNTIEMVIIIYILIGIIFANFFWISFLTVLFDKFNLFR